MESVPEGTSGIFSLLYVPYDLIGKDDNEIKNQVIGHIILIIKGIASMFRDYGFGAKTSSGYGIARSNLEDAKLILRSKNVNAAKDKTTALQAPVESFKKYLNENGSAKEEFKGSGEAGLLSTSEYSGKGQELGGGSQAEFKKFRRWYGAFVKDGKSTLHQEMLPVGGQSGHLVASISYWTRREMDRLT
jgi:CRISPR-associated protein Cmr2